MSISDDKPGRCLLIEGDATLNFRPVHPYIRKDGAIAYRDLISKCSKQNNCPFRRYFGRCPTGEEVVNTYHIHD